MRRTAVEHIIADAHNDLLVEVEFFRHEEHPFRDRWLDQLRRGRVGLQVCPASVDIHELPEWGMRRSLQQIVALHRAAAEDPDQVLLVRDAGDLETVLADGRTGLLLSMEGAEPLGHDPTLVDLYWLLGVRMFALTWNRRNPFADGLAEVTDGGLSALGGELIDRMAGLGMILDLAHASQSTFFQVLERAPDSPVVVSHACCRAVYDVPRNLTDDQLRALRDHGGVLCIMAVPLAVDLEAPSIDRVLDHIDHASEVMGVEHVGIGADFMAQIVESGAEPAFQASSLMPDGMSFGDAVPGLAGPSDYPALAAAMAARGYDDAALQAILSGNLLRVVADGLARCRAPGASQTAATGLRASAVTTAADVQMPLSALGQTPRAQGGSYA
jgi:membrane dipeptidase